LLGLCLFPVVAISGSITSTLGGSYVAQVLTPVLCPEGSSGEIITFATTTHDEYGNETPSTGYEMQCVDAAGNITREPSADYAFIWLAVVAGGGLLMCALLALLLSIPVNMLINRLFGKTRQPETITS
jgi:hypothetical protein